MIINNLHVMSVAIAPCEAQFPLIIDPYAVHASAVPLQRLEPITWRTSEIIQACGLFQHHQLPFCYPAERLKPRRLPAFKKRSGRFILKAHNHTRSVLREPLYCKHHRHHVYVLCRFA